MIRIAELYRYPVKSMGGERLDRAALTDTGIPGDRAWALKDERRGELTGAKKLPALMSMSARFVREPSAAERSPGVEISAADGARTASADPDRDRHLSGWLNHPVSLWPLLPAQDDAHYRRGPLDADTDIESMLRELFARTTDEPLPDVTVFPPILATHHSPPGTYFDAFPLLILSRNALSGMQRLAQASGIEALFDVRRFRPNLLLDAPGDGFIEDAFCGRELRIGSARVKVEMRCPRCIMTTHAVEELPRDPKIMRALVQQHGGDLGVYASVVEPGVVSVGDRIEVI